jgi:Mycolic acid cyclopropane synthetase
MKSLSQYVVFNDKKLARRYAHDRIPMATLYEAYFDGDIDIPDVDALLRDRDLFVKYTLTPGHLKWAVTNFVPEVTIHSKQQDQRIVREHYDRGNDFFGWFLGERMIYTSAFFQHAGETLEQAQDNKLNLVCQKLQVGLGHPRVPRGPLLRSGRHRSHALQESGTVRQRSREGVGRRRSRAHRVLRLPRHPQRQVRQDLEPGDGRARGREEPRLLLRAGS